MVNDYYQGYQDGLKEGKFRENCRLVQIALTALIILGGSTYLDYTKEKKDAMENIAQEIHEVREVPYTPWLFDENEPHKYNPKPSKSPFPEK